MTYLAGGRKLNVALMAPRKKVTLSMSGGGFLGIYHIGVASCFREMEEHFEVEKIAGASAGAIAAACYLCRCCLGQAASDVLKIAQMGRSSPIGPLSPRFRVVNALRNGLERILPDDAHIICSGRLSVSMTRCMDGGNKIVSHFESKAELIQALICSSFVPFYSGLVPPYFHDARYWDGGLTDNMPVFDPFTITISPFSGESDICPSDDFALSFMEMNFANQSFRLNSKNAFRLSRALFPPHPDVLREICEEGYIDALRFIKKTLLCEMVKGPSRLPFTPVTEAGTVDTSPPTPDQLPSSAFPPISHSSVETDDDTRCGIKNDEKARTSVETWEPMEGRLHRSNSVDQVMQILNRSSTTHNLPTPVMDALKEASESAQHPIIRALSFVAIPWVLPLEIVYSTCVRLIELTPRPVTMDVQHYLDIFARVAQNVADGLMQSHSRDGAWYSSLFSLSRFLYAAQNYTKMARISA
ncbi:hypothetical protein RvY_08662-2 [Ramazzottius varieornatus]|uniref:triacylglycerol lipase n=1 Tax=Ramazzottius varieornatus TaxID=947166 RepID=A0A1D1V6Q4_RAMVA|nr:hypothetical protein RvY_08662-2 [Ramazzottius varieornatus]